MPNIRQHGGPSKAARVSLRRMLHPKQGDRTAENCLLQMCHRLIRLILRAAIFDERVVGRIPSSSAAPSDP